MDPKPSPKKNKQTTAAGLRSRTVRKTATGWWMRSCESGTSGFLGQLGRTPRFDIENTIADGLINGESNHFKYAKQKTSNILKIQLMNDG